MPGDDVSHSSSADGVSGALDPVPARLRDLAAGVIATAEGDSRLLAVIAAGSVADGTADEHSDLDLVLVCTGEGRHAVLGDAHDFARRAGPLLVAFTGEHVGEPRLLIALYGPEPRHVDLKFIGIGDLDARVEDGLVLWQRDGSVEQALARTTAKWPRTEPQWIEDRFWVWVHYAVSKIGRGELFEAVDALTMIRSAALAPLVTGGKVAKPAGVRRIEQISPAHVTALEQTVAVPSHDDCLRALRATVELYRQLRETAGDCGAAHGVERRTAAEEAVLRCLDAFA